MDAGTDHIERSHARHVLGIAPRRARTLTIVLGALVVLVLVLDLGVVGFLAGLALAALPVPLYVALALWLDRFEAEPGTVLLRAFLWGAVVAIVVSLFANRVAFALLAGAFGAGAGDLLSGVLAAPAIEEAAKGVALLLLFLHHDDEFDNVTDGVVYAAMIGLGFAMTENALYYGRVWDTGALSSVFVLRGVIGPFAHPLFTAMTGVGVGIARERHGHGGSWIAPAIGFALAVLLHALWNAAASAQILFPTTYLVIMVPAFVAALFTVRRSGRREVDLLRTHLAPLVADGTFDNAQLDG
ncbi:MAG: PrsW family intramembrane metalloprotease, partial [Longimicrobiales bacterium]